MKKVLFLFFAAMSAVVSYAQMELTGENYEKKIVVTADSVKSGTLYVRALEALSDFAGSQGKSKINIDVQDKDEGLVVYKGDYYLGYSKVNILYGWDTFANFTLKVRCKDGKAQLTVTVSSLTFVWDADGARYTFPIKEFLPEYKYKGDYKIKKAAQKYAPTIPSTFDAILDLIGKRITKEPEDDF